MRVAALYDIHANLPGLEAVLREVEAAGPDRILMPVKAVKAPGLNFVPTAQPSPCSRRTSRVVGTPHTH